MGFTTIPNEQIKNLEVKKYCLVHRFETLLLLIPNQSGKVSALSVLYAKMSPSTALSL